MTDRTLVITGANGFVGAHVAEAAARNGHTVWAVGREPRPRDALAPHVDEYFSADLYSTWPVPTGRVDAVIHLAGLAAVGPSFTRPQQYLDVNSGIMTTMSEALLTGGGHPRVVVVSSGSVYAPPSVDASALDENAPLTPTSPYAVAKILVETQADYYSRRGLDTVIARPFNHIGPGQGRGFLVPDLAASLEDLPEGVPLTVGNLDAARDYTDVRDVAEAYLTLAFAATHDHHIYNVATGVSHTGHEVLRVIAEALNRPVPPLVTDPARLRPNDPQRITGNAHRLNSEFGWNPTITWQSSVSDYVAAAPLN